MSVLDLVREDLRDFAGYGSARSTRLQGRDWLNANEAPWPNAADVDGACRRYPEPQPQALVDALAALYRVDGAQLLVGRGSDEAIDLLVRATCRPGVDAVLATPPVFGMYAVAARLQGAAFVEVPLVEGAGGFMPDLVRVVDIARERRARIVFLCSPANPTGAAIAAEAIARVAEALRGQALVVVDEAYAEFSSQVSALGLLAAHENLVVLRTLSKAHALAGARVGVAIGHPQLIALLRRCQAPYPLPVPSVALACAALSAGALCETQRRIEAVCSERTRLFDGLLRAPGVRRVYPSDGNFLLVRCIDAEGAFAGLLAAGIVVRDQRGAAQLGDALRISIGTPEQNDRVLDVFGAPRDQQSVTSSAQCMEAGAQRLPGEGASR
ncbi:histidinol-phosphate transaminase [Luteimonas yindakuii]|nr:histidinol-phosphate transaminase [Luteimonas yindakuii]